MRRLALLSFVLAVGCVSRSPVTTPSSTPTAVETWGAKPPTPLPSSQPLPPISESACAKHSWASRGQAPIGYLKGMLRAYHQTLCRWKGPETTVAGVIGQPVQALGRDALARYAISPGPGIETVRATYTLGIGLGMRESSGKYCEGRDMTAHNVAADTAEAGAFQASYNSHSASADRLNGLWVWYKAHEDRCDLALWHEGLSAKAIASECVDPPWGTGPGRDWQEFTRSCPAFAAEWAMTLLRTLPAHFGPIVRHEAEYFQPCNDLLKQMDEVPCS